MTRHEVAVDTEIAEIGTRVAKARSVLAYARKAAAGERGYTLRPGEPAAAEAALDAALDEYYAAEARYTGWSRFFLVQNTGGHIHSSMNCSTCYPTTQFGWLVELAGLTEAEAVAEYGEILCSVCYPSAPVAWTTGENKKVAAERELHRALTAIAKSPEGKRVTSAAQLVDRKAYAIERHEKAIRRSQDAAAEPGWDPPAWVLRDAERAEAELPKLRKQLARAEAKLADATTALNAALTEGNPS